MIDGHSTSGYWYHSYYEPKLRTLAVSNMVWYEQRGEGEEVWKAAAHVALNSEAAEVKGPARTVETLDRLLDRRFAYTGVEVPLDKVGNPVDDTELWKDILHTVSLVMAGEIDDPTGGAVIFSNVSDEMHPGGSDFWEIQVYESTLLAKYEADNLADLGYGKMMGNTMWFVYTRRGWVKLIQGEDGEWYVEEPVLPDDQSEGN
jgi:hypothetical protein